MIPCRWLEAGAEIEDEPIKWVIAWMCERCGKEGVFDICEDHYRNYFRGAIMFACSECHGDVSYITQEIHGHETWERFTQ